MNATQQATPKTPPPVPTFAQLESRDPVLEFGAVKGMDYRKRMRVVRILIAVGFALQIVFLNVWFGLPFILAALVLSWVRGYDNRVDHRHPDMSSRWETAETSGIDEILDLDHRMKKWDASLTDLSCGRGAAMFFATLIVLGVIVLLLASRWPSLAWIVGVDSLLLVIPQWFSGMRGIQRRGDLVLKAAHVSQVLGRLHESDLAHGVLKAKLLMVGPDEERVPTNFKVAVAYPEGPDGFHGVQAQVVINRVQGTGYPYFYACLVAEQGLGLLKKGRPKSLPKDVIQETQTKDGVDVVIIRQHTTKTSGYHTKPDASLRILRTALEAARRFADA